MFDHPAKLFAIGAAGGVLVAGISFGVAACDAGTPVQGQHDDTHSGSLQDVRVQSYPNPATGKTCLVFTHDTAQGASIAVAC